jgi:hypothetical protein
MAFCENTVIFPYFTISRVFRDKISIHYVFVGLEMLKNTTLIPLFKSMSDGIVPQKNDIKILKNMFGDYNVDLWISSINLKESIFFINDRIWTDDTIFQIKTKIFTYLSNVKGDFIIQSHQELWMNIENKKIILGTMYEKEIELQILELLMFEPAITTLPKIDNSFLTTNDERTSDFRVVKEEYMLLHDIINRINLERRNKSLSDINELNYNPHIFLYVLDDEISWIKNNPIIENDISINMKRIWNGYISKHWPSASVKKSIDDETLKLYTGSKTQINIINNIISSVRETKKNKQYDPKLENCIISKMNIWTRPPLIEGAPPYRLNMIYNYLRTLVSDKMPFVYYTQYGDKIPHVSIDENSILKKKLHPNEIYDWVFKKLPNTKSIPKGRSGTIQLKVYSYTTKDGTSKYSTVTLFQNSYISIALSFEEYTGYTDKDIEKVISLITDIITDINNNFLVFHKHPLFSVPKLSINNGEFVFSKNTNMQFYEVIVVFQSKKIINFEELTKYMNNYKPFVDISFFTSDDDTLKNKQKAVNIKYNRISESAGLPMIFEFIDKEKLSHTSSEIIIETIIKKYGKSRHQAADIYNQWRILKTDKQVAKELLKHPGVNIDIKKSEDFESNNKKYKYKIFIKGLKSLYILRNCYFVLQNILSSFFNPKKQIKTQNKLKFNKNIKFEFGFDQEIPNSLSISKDIIKNISNSDGKNNSSILDISIKNMLDVSNNIKSKNNIEFSSTEHIDMTNESGIDPKIRLKCPSNENKLTNKGICKNICDFPNFKLNRLQHFEPKVFKFQAKGYNEPYSRLCNDQRRPIVMTYDPTTNPKIDKKSYTYSLKYKSSKDDPAYHYICPQAWCPICEIPIPLEKVTNIFYDKIKDCESGKCPNGDHNVFINRKGKNELYPGFLNPVGNPNGLCMPCCFKNNKLHTTVYKRCINLKNKETESSNENILNVSDIGDTGNTTNVKKYISRRDKIPLEEGRFGLIPSELEVFFGQSNNCESGNIKNGFDCYVRKGIVISKKSEAFLNTILDLISGVENKPITKKEFINKIISSLDEKLFCTLSGGLLKRIFTTLDNYNTFLLNKNSVIQDIYIWDICTRPGIFIPEGINIIIFTSHSIFCPFGQNINDIYSLNKLTLLVYKFGDIYEPIYKLQYNDSKLEVTYLQNSTDPIIYKIINTAIKGCESYDEIDWDKAGKINKIEELNLKQTIEKINGNYKIILQIADSYSKTTAIILDNNLYVPVKPSSIDTNYPYLTTYKDSDIPILSFDKTFKYLNEVGKNTDLPLKPIYLIEFNSMIIGILLETNRIVPIIPIKLSNIKTKLKVADMFYYPDVNSQNYNQSYKEKRIISINEYQYKNEAFSRFKYEISRYLQTKKGKPSKDKITNIIEQPNNLNKYSDLKTIIDNLTSILIASPNESTKKIESVTTSLDKYTSPLLRKACYELNKKEGDQDPHCVCKGKTCKLVNLVKTNFTEKLIDILLRYPIQRDDILSGTLSMIDLKTSLDKPQVGEILLTGNKLDQEFSKLLFGNKQLFYLHMLKDIDFSQPTFEGIDKKSYLKIKKGTEKNIKTYSIVEITQNWTSIMDPSFRLISSIGSCNSLYYIFAEIAKKITNNYLEKNYKKRNNLDIENITNENIKDIYSNFILQMEPVEIQNIAKNVIPNISTLDNIIDMSDLYNLYNEKNKILSVDDLTTRIKIGFPAYKPNKFDVIMLSYMLNINVVLLRSSISELIGKQFVDSGLYVVIYYDPLVQEECIRFYLLQKDAILYITEFNSILKKLLT